LSKSTRIAGWHCQPEAAKAIFNSDWSRRIAPAGGKAPIALVGFQGLLQPAHFCLEIG
jgi:hypothetical protein